MPQPFAKTTIVALLGLAAMAPTMTGCAKRSAQPPAAAQADAEPTTASVSVKATDDGDLRPLAPPSLGPPPTAFQGPPLRPGRVAAPSPESGEIVAPPEAIPASRTTSSSAIGSEAEVASRALAEQAPTASEYASPNLELPRTRLIRRREEWTEAEAAADALGRIGPPAIPEVVKMLDDSDASVRRRGAEILARIRSDAEEAIPALIRLGEQDADPQVRKAAAFALGQMGAKAAPAVPMLTRMLRSSN